MDICGMIWALFHWPEIKGKWWPWFFNLTSKANMVGGTFFEVRLLCAICSLVTNKADIYRLCIFVTFFWFRLRTFGGHIFAQIWWLGGTKTFYWSGDPPPIEPNWWQCMATEKECWQCVVDVLENSKSSSNTNVWLSADRGKSSAKAKKCSKAEKIEKEGEKGK